MKIETFKDPNAYWGVQVDGMMDTDARWAATEQGAEREAERLYPGEKVITTDDPEHYSRS